MAIRSGIALFLAGSALVMPLTPSSSAVVPDQQLLSSFHYRNTGPFRMGARVSDIAVPNGPEHNYTFYVSFWTGGLWKTTNNGTTFEPIFDKQDNLAIGDVTIAPSNPNVVWVGTGAAFTSRSSFAGDGVYKSTDAGKTWANMGLKDSHHISRIQIDPTNPDNVYVAAMGHLYSDNAERGVFHSSDGGKTWEKSLFISDKVGIIDLVMNSKNPKILYAAAYDKKRLPWQMINGGPGSGIYKTEDGGKTWRRLSGGLPGGRIGRIGLDIYQPNPNILYAVIENANTATRPLGPDDKVATRGEVYRTDDGGEHWVKTTPDGYNATPKGPYYFAQIRVDQTNDKRIIITGEPFKVSEDGGKTWPKVLFKGMFGDFRTVWFDPQNGKRMMVGSDGGLAVSYDGGETATASATFRSARSTISATTWPSRTISTRAFRITSSGRARRRGRCASAPHRGTGWRWATVTANIPRLDTKDTRWVYTTREYGGLTRVDMKDGFETNITPQPPAGEPPYRFLWTTPLVLSPHNSAILYTGGQRLLKSTDRGDHWTAISPDLSTNPADKVMRESETGLPGGIPWFAISTISESPLTAGVIWAGTADGKVQMTRNAGKSWTDFTARLTKLGAREDAMSRASRPLRMCRAGPMWPRAATSSMTSSRTSIAPTISARPGPRFRRDCPTSRSTSSSRIRRIRTCCSSATIPACSSRWIAAITGPR